MACCHDAPRDTLVPFLAIIICILLILISFLGQQERSYHHIDNSSIKTQYVGISTNGK
ncbi:p6 product [Pea stem necrosis virus]|uniref:p6 product n=1 Tax=Pea stem necrosis virus TaxID=199361 RepID=Q7T4K0_9TOMB|nr:p6 product [Pea stem necrosis virus]BAC78645.1 p6 product [Pea stem necrosis virus]